MTDFHARQLKQASCKNTAIGNWSELGYAGGHPSGQTQQFFVA
jgi:hypothetical protein